VSCADTISEKQIAAQVGNSVLTFNEIKMKMPLALSSVDSAAFATKYIDEWVNERMLYEQGLKNLPNIDLLNQQVEDYRHNLIAQSYENEIIEQYMSKEITETACQEFYNQFSQQIKLDYPIVQAVFVKLLQNSSKVKDVKKWLEQLNEGKTDCIEEFDQFGTQRAADYENCFDTWVSMYRITDKLPATVVDPALFLKRKTYEMQDESYYYLFVIKDFRLAGEVAPYEYAKSDVYELLAHKERKDIRAKLLEELKKDGLESGFVKINK
ncbi:MAG: hypothetical protein HUJ97_06375, partial [Bacteroidales bacterium]|nr:hypothetical protein [Bacteroidales bacterium]